MERDSCSVFLIHGRFDWFRFSLRFSVNRFDGNGCLEVLSVRRVK